MANLGSTDTPIVGESFGLPSGWALVENTDGEIVIEDSGGNVVFRRDETAGEWVTDSIDAESVDVDNAVAAEQLGMPVYSDDANAPNDTLFYNDADDQTRYKDPAGSIVVTDALSQSEVTEIAASYDMVF